MTLEELSILYTADVAPAMESIRLLSDAVRQSGAETEKMEQLFSSAGYQAAQGLAGGILSGQGAVMNAARQVAEAAAQALKAALDIHSPSRVTWEMGAQFDQGLAGGILSGVDVVAGAVEGMTTDAAGAAMGTDAFPDEPISAPGGDIHLTIPIEMDGYQLGLAAIDGINRVSRISGRAEISF